jgi:glycosyltransferase involved in cell wall biosynthesis
MPAFNTRRFAPAAVDSILEQTFSDFEFIIVDDASSDGVSALFDSYASRDPRIRVLRNASNAGFVRSRNRGIEAATGEFIANMDSDDVAFPERLERQVAFMRAHSDVGVCGADVILIDDQDRELGRRRYPLDDAAMRARWFLFNPLAQPLTMMRRAAIETVGLYNPELILADDLDLWFRIGRHYKLANLGEPLLKYRVHAGSATGSQLRQMQRAVLRVRTIARREYGYRPTLLARAAQVATACVEIVPPTQRIAMFNWLRTRMQ